MRRRALSVLLAVCMVVSMMSTAAFAASRYVDIDGHWGEAAIEHWSDAGIVEGIGDNRFDPDGLLTRAAAAKILAGLLRLNDVADITAYTDCVPGAWYYLSVAKCVAAGIMNGTSATTMSPNAPVTREQMFTMYSRALSIEGKNSTDRVFADAWQVDGYAQPYVNALLELGYINGTSVTTLSPNATMKRAELMQMLYNSIEAYITEGGKYEVEGDGIVLIVTDEDVQLTGDFDGTIIVTQPETEVSLKGIDGEPEVIVYADDVEITNAPVGTTITSANGAEGVTANGKEVDKNDSIVIEEKKGSGNNTISRPSKPSCKHDEFTYEKNDTDGTHKVICSECDEVIDEDEECEYETTTEPTCGTAGSKTCSMCEDVVVIPATGEHINATYENNNNGTHTVKCSVCSTASDAVENCAAYFEEVAGSRVEPDINTTGSVTKKCSRCGYEFTETLPKLDYKFYLGVTSAGTTVDMTVFKDYSAVINFPGSKTVDANTVTVTAQMKDVASLGVEGERKHEMTINTNLGVQPNLGAQLGAISSFKKATVNVDVDGEKFTYEIVGEKGAVEFDNVITATPDSEDAARAAWKELTSHVKATTGEDDSKIVIEKGSYLWYGTEKLNIDKTLTLDNLNEMSALEDMIRDCTSLKTGKASKVEAYLAAGSTLAVGSSQAVLEDNALIEVTGVEVVREGVLSTLKNATDGKTMVKTMVDLLNATVAGASDGEVNVKITFPEPLDYKFYLGVTSAGATVDMTVFEDYSAVINFPGSKTVDANTVTVTAKMQNVASLDVTGVREHSMTINTNLGVQANLGAQLGAISSFKKATVNVDVDGKEFTYNIEGEAGAEWFDNVITATPDSVSDARAAWKELTSNVTEFDGEGDSKILIGALSSLQIGTELLTVDEELALDNLANMEALEETIRDCVTLGSATEEAVEIVLTAGTALVIDDSAVKLVNDMTITVEGVEFDEGTLADLKDATGARAIVKAFVNLLNKTVMGMNEQTVKITIAF